MSKYVHLRIDRIRPIAETLMPTMAGFGIRRAQCHGSSVPPLKLTTMGFHVAKPPDRSITTWEMAMSVFGSRVATLILQVLVVLGIFAVCEDLQAGVTKIAPPEAEAGHPFTIIDTSGRRLVDGSVALFRQGSLEVQLPLRTHKPFNTATGRLASDMYSGTYEVSILLPDNSSFEISSFTVLGENHPPPTIAYEFNESISTTSTIGVDGGSIELSDTAGASFALWLPAGAVSADTALTLTQVESVPSFLPGFRVLSAVRLQPDGSSFSPAANLSIGLPSGVRTGKPAFGFVSAEDGTNLIFTVLSGTNPVDAALSDYTVQMPIRHFSVAGVAESDGTADFPPPPPASTAQDRAEHAIADRASEILDSGGELIGDPVIYEIFLDWLENPTDSLRLRLDSVALNPDPSNLDSLADLNSEANDFLLRANDYLEGSALDAFYSAVLELMAGASASYLESLKTTYCSIDTLQAQSNLWRLDISIIGQFVDGDLQEIFEDEVFACRYETIFSVPFQGVFTNETAILEYQILQQDGTFFPGSLDDLQLNYDVSPVNGLILSDSPQVTVDSIDLGPSMVSVTIEDGPTSSADILWIPSFIGGYQGVASGRADGCRDPGDEGAGGGFFAASGISQLLLLASTNSAVISVSFSGDYGLEANATIDLSTIETGFAAGNFTGNLSYSYSELDEGSVYQVVGNGSFSGIVNATATSKSVIVEQYSGTSNWCTNYVGMAQLESG